MNQSGTTILRLRRELKELREALNDCADELAAVEQLMVGPEFAAARYNVRKRAQQARIAIAKAEGKTL